MSTNKIAVVTGANRGIGKEIARQLASKDIHVIMTARNPESGESAANELRAEQLDVEFFRLDVTSDSDVSALSGYIAEKYGKIDILVNNAGVLLEGDRANPPISSKILDANVDIIRNTFEINTMGALKVSLALVKSMQVNGYGRIVNVSSGMGSMGEWSPGFPGYRISKVSLNMITRLLAAEVDGQNILVNSVCPGWVRTDMGGPNAKRSLAEGAYGPVRLATLADNGPNGGFFRDDKEVPW